MKRKVRMRMLSHKPSQVQVVCFKKISVFRMCAVKKTPNTAIWRTQWFVPDIFFLQHAIEPITTIHFSQSQKSFVSEISTFYILWHNERLRRSCHSYVRWIFISFKWNTEHFSLQINVSIKTTKPRKPSDEWDDYRYLTFKLNPRIF